MDYYYPFGEKLHRLLQQDRTPKKVFVLGVYASAVHAKWMPASGKKARINALAIASEPCIFWDGDDEYTKGIIKKINARIPKEIGHLELPSKGLNGPSAIALTEKILNPLGYDRKQDAWLCDMLPETRINPNQKAVLEREYNPLISKYNLNICNIPVDNNEYCNIKRCEEIIQELFESQASTIILLGDKPIKQFLKKVADFPFSNLDDYVFRKGKGYATPYNVIIKDKEFRVILFAHPRLISGMNPKDNKKWFDIHNKWQTAL